jgi:iron-sulfur cluster repair protein YtfE (RIC family)
MWDQTASTPAPSTVRSEVLEQHETLRALMSRVLDRARGQQSDDFIELVHLAHEVRRRFRAHLAFEERVLVPVLTSADGWGPERVRNLLDEHADQRAQLDALVAGLEAGWERPQVARAIDGLARDILRDMLEEERDYLNPELLSDDPIRIH